MRQQAGQKTPSEIVEEELRRINAPVLKQELRGHSSAIMALGVFEMLAGVLAILYPFFAGALFSVLLGATVAASGIFEVVNGISHGSAGRLIVGLIGLVAGIIVAANPVASLLTLSLVLGVFLLASGIAQLSLARGNGWALLGGILGVVLGIELLVRWPVSGLVSIGLFVGAYIIVSGITTFLAGSRLRRASAQ